ncbi:MAG: hypothetical protein AB1452_12820, partial [Pseudomonadota bacterium]
MTGEGLLVSLGKIALAVAIGLPLVVYLAQDALIFYRQPTPESRGGGGGGGGGARGAGGAGGSGRGGGRGCV